MKKLNKKGFTLVEVLAVVAIIGVLGLISVPSVLSSINNSKKASYNILIDNIKTASVSLYEEIDLMGSSIYQYEVDGSVTGEVKIAENTINVNLQTLVNNGFLKGSKNDLENSSNKNKLVLLNPKTNEDMGICMIEIKKNVGDKTTYTIESVSENSFCPEKGNL